MKYSSDPEGTKYVSCSNEDCEMWIVPMILPDLWNRIRIAPDDLEVNHYDDETLHEGMTHFNDWMNPRYPKADETKPRERL